MNAQYKHCQTGQASLRLCVFASLRLCAKASRKIRKRLSPDFSQAVSGIGIGFLGSCLNFGSAIYLPACEHQMHVASTARVGPIPTLPLCGALTGVAGRARRGETNQEQTQERARLRKGLPAKRKTQDARRKKKRACTRKANDLLCWCVQSDGRARTQKHLVRTDLRMNCTVAFMLFSAKSASVFFVPGIILRRVSSLTNDCIPAQPSTLSVLRSRAWNIRTQQQHRTVHTATATATHAHTHIHTHTTNSRNGKRKIKTVTWQSVSCRVNIRFFSKEPRFNLAPSCISQHTRA